jgi:CIC family chloride channel protein
MNREHDSEADDVERRGSLLVLACLAPIVGALSGLIGGVFRLSLEYADAWRDAAIALARDWAQGQEYLGLLIVAGACGVAVAVAAGLVRRFAPPASGSGIPHVEAVMRGELSPAPLSLIPVKFVGGFLAIGSGLALGREGPSVQMGAGVGHLIGLAFRCPWPIYRVLIAAGAGAGLATAFNAPIAGAIFVLEELVRRFEAGIAIAALGASAAAIAVARLILGDMPDFAVQAFVPPSHIADPLFFTLGALAGLLAVVYNRTLLATLALASWLGRVPVELRAGVIGAAVGALAWFVPDLVGGGDVLTQRALEGRGLLAVLPLILLLRLALGAVSYAAGTPGGLFAPMLVLGAELGLMFGLVCRLAFPDLGVPPTAFAVVGMAAFFTGVVRAPLTGIVLVTEMTASVTLLLPILVACFAAMLVPALLRDVPIYDALRERLFERSLTPSRSSRGRRD